MKKIVLASSNVGKLAEFSTLLAPMAFEVVPQGVLGIPDAPEPFGTFVENALAKARHASRESGLPALADDSGLCVPALGNAPGVHSARYAGEPKDDTRNSQKLIAALEGRLDRRAFYVCVLVWLAHENDPQPLMAEGEWHGEIVTAPRGSGGFGYDPYFLVPAHNCTAAELSAETKNHESHRGIAMRVLAQKMQRRLSPAS